MKNSPQHRILFLLIVLIATVIACCCCYFYKLYFSIIFFAIIGAFIVYRIIYWQKYTTKIFIGMLEDIKYNDYSLHFNTKNKSKTELYLIEKMNQIMGEMKSNYINKEEQTNYYETLLNIIDSCLIVVNEQDNIYWTNQQTELQLCGYTIHSLKELEKVHKDLPSIIKEIKPKEIRALRIYKNDIAVDMAITVTNYQKKGQHFKLVHLRNIRTLLEENEMEAWQKLIRVLTHEIMNSITPIISLSDTLCCNIQNKEWTEENLPLLNQGLQTIHRRSKGLLNFVENYRRLTRIPTPTLSPISISDLLNSIKKLYNNLPIIYNIEDPNHILLIDRNQIEQVLINLIKNSTEACSDQPSPQIKISTFSLPDSKLFTLTISDNGCGILPEVIDKIFVPFFTTKPTGSGIGLSLCKQIINLHGGKITVESRVNEGATFTIKFIE